MNEKLHNELAKLFIKSLDKDSLTVLAFGMIPNNEFEQFFKIIKKSFVDSAIKKFGAEMNEESRNEYINYLDKKYIAEFKHELSLAIYRNAKMVV